MLTHTEAYLYFDKSLDKLKGLMRREGFFFPYIFIAHRGEIDISIEDESVIDKQCSSEPDKYGVNLAYFVLKGSPPGYAKDIGPLAERIVDRIDPDSLGVFIPGLYKEGKEEVIRKIKTLEGDPDSIQIIHGVYYTREDIDARMCIIPYTNHGKLPDDPERDEGVVHDINFADFGWDKPSSKIGPCIESPYKRRF